MMAEQFKHTCPECGGDAARTRDRYPFTTHGTRAYLWITFLIITTSVMGMIVYASSWESNQWDNNRALGRKSLSQPVDPSSLSAKQLRDALQGEDALTQLFADKIREVIQIDQNYTGPIKVENIRLELGVFDAEETIHTRYSAFGHIGSNSKDTRIEDIRVGEPASDVLFRRYTPTQRWWPEYYRSWNTPDRVTHHIVSVSYLHILSMCSTAVLFSWIIAKLPRLRKSPTRAFVCTLIFLILAATTAIFVTRNTTTNMQSMSYRSQDTGAWFEASIALGWLDDPQQTRILLRALSGQLNLEQPTSRAVTIGYEYEAVPQLASEKRLNHSEGLQVKIPQAGLHLFNMRTVRYDPPRSPDRIHMHPTQHLFHDLWNWGRLHFRSSSPMQNSFVSISVFNLILIASIPWWIWIVLSRIHKFRTWRVQRKRVNRGQCIYCGYRVPEQARAARWAEPSSSNAEELGAGS